MDRKEKLMKLVNNSNADVIVPLIDKLLFLENQLEQLEKLPMIKFNSNNPEQQKTTPAAKLYKEFLQQYTNVVKIISHVAGDEHESDVSPLREWVKSRGV